MNQRLQHALIYLGIAVAYFVPLLLVWWGFRMRRQWRRVRGLERVEARDRGVAAQRGPSEGFHFSLQQVVVVYAAYIILIGLAILARGHWISFLPQALYLALVALTWWSAFSPRQFAIERSRDPGLTRSGYVTLMLGTFGIMPLAVWFGVGLPILLVTLHVVRGH